MRLNFINISAKEINHPEKFSYREKRFSNEERSLIKNAKKFEYSNIYLGEGINCNDNKKNLKRSIKRVLTSKLYSTSKKMQTSYLCNCDKKNFDDFFFEIDDSWLKVRVRLIKKQLHIYKVYSFKDFDEDDDVSDIIPIKKEKIQIPIEATKVYTFKKVEFWLDCQSGRVECKFINKVEIIDNNGEVLI